MRKELKDIMEKDNVEYAMIDPVHYTFKQLTFKEIKEKQVSAKTVVNKLIESRDAIKKNEYLNKLNYTEISFSVLPYALSLSDNINTDSKNLISNEIFVHDDLIGINLNGWSTKMVVEDENDYSHYYTDDLFYIKGITESPPFSRMEAEKVGIPYYDETYIVSISDLKNELDKNDMSFEEPFSIKEILGSIEHEDWFTIILDKDIHIGNSLSEDDVIEYLSSSAKQKLDMAYSFNMPYICEKVFESASKKEKKLMVIDILTNCEDNLNSFMEEAKKIRALDEPIYIMGYSLKDYINGNEKQESILKQLGHNHEYPEVRITEAKQKIISDLFKTKDKSEKQKFDFITSEYQKIK